MVEFLESLMYNILFANGDNLTSSYLYPFNSFTLLMLLGLWVQCWKGIGKSVAVSFLILWNCFSSVPLPLGLLSWRHVGFYQNILLKTISAGLVVLGEIYCLGLSCDFGMRHGHVYLIGDSRIPLLNGSLGCFYSWPNWLISDQIWGVGRSILQILKGVIQCSGKHVNGTNGWICLGWCKLWHPPYAWECEDDVSGWGLCTIKPLRIGNGVGRSGSPGSPGWIGTVMCFLG